MGIPPQVIPKPLTRRVILIPGSIPFMASCVHLLRAPRGPLLPDPSPLWAP